MAYVEQVGEAFLLVNNGVYSVEYAGQTHELTRPDGTPYVENSRFTFTHIEPYDTGYVAVLQFSDGTISLRWFDATGTLTRFTAPGSVESYVEREAEIGIDLNGDGGLSMPVTEIEQDGAASLAIVDGIYTVDSSAGSVTLKRDNGKEYSENSAYSFTHVEPSGDGYVAVLEFADGTVSLRWFDATGTLTTFTAPDTLESYVEREGEIGIDLNGDGELSVPTTVVEQEGAASLAIVDGVYTVDSSAGSVTLKRDNGKEYSENSAYSFTHVEPSGDGYVAVLQFADGSISLRWFDATGTLTTFTAPDTLESYVEREGEIGIDLNGDGELSVPTTVVEQEGAASLAIVDGVYTVDSSAGPVTLKRDNGVEYSENDVFSFTHAEPTEDGYVAVLEFADGTVSLRWFDATGTLTTFTAPDTLESYVEREGEIGIDLNGDGELSVPTTVVEQEGAASLAIVDGVYTVDSSAGPVTLKRDNGVEYSENDAFSFTHAEPTEDGGYVAVLEFADGTVSLRWFDATGTLTTFTAPETLETYIEREAEIGIDLNGDGVLSSPAPAGEVIDTMGDATLLLTESGYELEIAGVSNPVLGEDGQQLTSDGNFTLARFAQDGGTSEYVLVGEYADSGEFDIYIVDPQGALIQRFGPMSEAVTQAFELDHQIDLTGDGVIGRGEAASQGTTTELFTDWSTGGAIRGDAADNDVVVNNYLDGAYLEESWVDVYGGDGNDILVGGDGENLFVGGAGDDVLYAGDRAINGENWGDQEAIYDSRGNGATQAPDYRLETDGTVTIFDDTGDLYSIRLNGETGTVTDLSVADGLDEGTDSLVAIDAVFVITDQGEIGVGFNPDTGAYVVKSQNEEFIEIEQDEYGWLEGEISGTNAADVIDVSTRPEFSEFGPDNWIDIEGNGGNDTLTGHDGGNWITGGMGDDQIDGGAGWDVAGYELFDMNDYSPFLDYRDNGDGSVTITKNDVDVFNVVLNLDGTGTVTDLREGPENLGTDTLTNIEQIEFEGSVDWLAIERTDAGYQVSGTKYPDYYINEVDGYGHISGTAFDDVLEVTAENGFDPLIFNEFSHVGISGRAGNDTMIGHIGGNWFEGGRGDDIIDGGSEPSSAWDAASYSTEDYSAFDLFFGSAEGVYQYDFREEADGSVTVFVNEQDLYNINLAGGEGWVQDLWIEDGDTGRDTLLNIDTVDIDTPVGYLSINYSAGTGYDIFGNLIRNYVWAESYDDGLGSGVIHGTANDDVINAADFSEVNASDELATIDFDASEGNDVMTGHAGVNNFYTGYNDGNDTMNGGAGYDQVSYSNFDEYPYQQFMADGRWEAGVRDNGGGDYTVYVDGVDLFSVVFDSNNNATVTDLWMEDGDSGIDQLNDIESISFDGPVGWADFDVDPESGVRVYSDDYQPDVIDNGDGTASIIGTYNDDIIVTSDYTELDLSTASTITIEGSGGNDMIEGHDGTNILIGGEGDDLMDGAGGIDAAVYQSAFWSDSTTAPDLNAFVDGSVVTISDAVFGDLYRVDLNAEVAMDTIGEVPAEASTALTAGNAVRSSFEASEDRDTFAVDVEAGQTYIIRGFDDYTDGQPALPWVTNVGDESGNYAGDWFYMSDEMGEYVEFTPEATGTVYVTVESFQLNEGDYTLEVLPIGTDVAGETVEVPSEYVSGVTVEDLSYDDFFEGSDFVANTEQFGFTVDNYSGQNSVVEIDQTDTGYDILVNGVKTDDVAVA